MVEQRGKLAKEVAEELRERAVDLSGRIRAMETVECVMPGDVMLSLFKAVCLPHLMNTAEREVVLEWVSSVVASLEFDDQDHDFLRFTLGLDACLGGQSRVAG